MVTETWEATGFLKNDNKGNTVTDEEGNEVPYTHECTWRGVRWGRVMRDEFHTERYETLPTIRIFKDVNSFGSFPSARRLTKFVELVHAIDPEIAPGSDEHKTLTQEYRDQWTKVPEALKPAHWGISGTPWGRSPGETVEYTRTFQSASWIERPNLKTSRANNFKRLDARFMVLRKKGAEVTKKEVDAIAVDIAMAL